jgi:hypothetical protein
MLSEKDFCHLRLGLDTLIQDFLSSKVLNKHLPKMKLTSEGKIIGSIYNDSMRRNPNLHLRFYNRSKRQVFQLIVTNYLDMLTDPTEPYIVYVEANHYDSKGEITEVNHFEVSSNGRLEDLVGLLEFMKYNYLGNLLLRYLHELYPSLKEM